MTLFIVSLTVTVLALAAVVVTGVKARRSAHYVFVTLTLASLGWAIGEARLVGDGLVFDGAAASVKTVHFVAVAATFLLLPLMVVSGVRLHRVECPVRRLQHKRLAWAFLVAVIVTCVLGTAMTMLATPVDAVGG